jgi:hypothetical protein
VTRTIDVELVHLDDCPLWRGAAERLQQAMGRAGVDPASLRDRSIATEDAPADFPGSPTILIDGRDPFAGAMPGGPACRRYPTEHGLDFAPSVEQLVEVLTR